MQFRHAKKLHNEDEVTVKETGEVCRVLMTQVIDKKRLPQYKLKRPTVFIEVVNKCNCWAEYMHTEVK